MKLFAALLALTLSAGAASAASFDLLRPVPGGATAGPISLDPLLGDVMVMPDPADPSREVLFLDNILELSILIDEDGSDGSLLYFDAGFNSLSGPLSHARLLDDGAELLFEVDTDEAGVWGELVLATLSVSGLTSAPTSFFDFDGLATDVTLTAVQPIPLPAALPMLAGGLAALAAAGRRRRG